MGREGWWGWGWAEGPLVRRERERGEDWLLGRGGEERDRNSYEKERILKLRKSGNGGIGGRRLGVERGRN